MFRKLFSQVPVHERAEFWTRNRKIGSAASILVPNMILAYWLQTVKWEMEADNEAAKSKQLDAESEKVAQDEEKVQSMEVKMKALQARLDALEGNDAKPSKAVEKTEESPPPSQSTSNQQLSGIGQRALARMKEQVVKDLAAQNSAEK